MQQYQCSLYRFPHYYVLIFSRYVQFVFLGFRLLEKKYYIYINPISHLLMKKKLWGRRREEKGGVGGELIYVALVLFQIYNSGSFPNL